MPFVNWHSDTTVMSANLRTQTDNRWTKLLNSLVHQYNHVKIRKLILTNCNCPCTGMLERDLGSSGAPCEKRVGENLTASGEVHSTLGTPTFIIFRADL